MESLSKGKLFELCRIICKSPARRIGITALDQAPMNWEWRCAHQNWVQGFHVETSTLSSSFSARKSASQRALIHPATTPQASEACPARSIDRPFYPSTAISQTSKTPRLAIQSGRVFLALMRRRITCFQTKPPDSPFWPAFFSPSQWRMSISTDIPNMRK